MKDLTPAEESFLMDMIINVVEKLPARLVFGLIGYCVSRLEELEVWTPGLESKVIDSLIPDSGEKEVVQ